MLSIWEFTFLCDVSTAFGRPKCFTGKENRNSTSIIAITSANYAIFSIQLKNFTAIYLYSNTLTIIISSDTVTLTLWRVVTKAGHIGMCGENYLLFHYWTSWRQCHLNDHCTLDKLSIHPWKSFVSSLKVLGQLSSSNRPNWYVILPLRNYNLQLTPTTSSSSSTSNRTLTRKRSTKLWLK